MIRKFAVGFLALVLLAALIPGAVRASSIAKRWMRGPSKQFLLGTDDLGRDRFRG